MSLKQSQTPPPIITLDEDGINNLATELVSRTTDPSQRAVLSIAGIPGSGKSTLAAAIAGTLNRHRPGSTLLLPMDGFHMTNDKLQQLGLCNRKGAPQTFEAQRYIKLLAELRDARRSARIPIFDRTIDEPVFTDDPQYRADTGTRFVVTEGNYLLMDQLPWNEIAHLTDLSVWLDTPVQQAKQWVIDRHKRFGRTPQEAKRWYESNDALNVEHILDHSRHADRIARWPDSVRTARAPD